MDTDNDPTDSGVPRRTRIGSMAQRKREQLRRFDEMRRKKAEEIKREREELARALKEVEARERRRAANARMNSLKRGKFVLGGLLVAKLRAGGQLPLTLTQEDINGLAKREQALFTELLEALAASLGETAEVEGDVPPEPT
jgi:hypothetical protein